MNQKTKIIKASNILKGTNIYTNHHLTRVVRRIQIEIRKKLHFNRKEFKWSNRDDELIRIKDWAEEREV